MSTTTTRPARQPVIKSFPTPSGPSRLASCRADFVAEETSHTGALASFLRPRTRPAVLVSAAGGVCRGSRKTGLLSLSLYAAIGVALLWAGDAEARYPTRARVERALSAIEKGPSKAGLVRAFGADVERVLREIVSRPSHAVLARVRALTVLRSFPSKRTRELLAKEIAATKGKRRGLPLIFLRQALTSYAVVAGKTAVSTIAPLLAHPSLDVRVDAGEALRLSGSPKARALIAKRAKSDPSATVRAELGRQLQLLDRAADQARRR